MPTWYVLFDFNEDNKYSLFCSPWFPLLIEKDCWFGIILLVFLFCKKLPYIILLPDISCVFALIGIISLTLVKSASGNVFVGLVDL